MLCRLLTCHPCMLWRGTLCGAGVCAVMVAGAADGADVGVKSWCVLDSRPHTVSSDSLPPAPSLFPKSHMFNQDTKTKCVMQQLRDS